MRGHIDYFGVFWLFPHRCPGEQCAIRRWIDGAQGRKDNMEHQS